ncbi:hypothetical protein ACFL96_19965 [Thermoproteota archaeon]
MINHNQLKILVIVALIISTISVYLLFFEILVTEGSFRESLGPLFLIPITILASAQVFITGALIHRAAIDLNKNHNAKKYDIFVITGLNAFLYSLIYAIFPITGPFHYITFTMQETSLLIMLTEIGWTTFTVVTVTIALKKAYSLSWFHGFILGTVSYILIIAFAS